MTVRTQQQHGTARNRLARLAGATGAVGGVGLIAAAGADAATINVTNLNDAGPGSLRAAVNIANGDAALDNIVFGSSLSGTLELTGGEIPIDTGLTISGPGPDRVRIDADDNSRHFHIDPSIAGVAYDPVSISGLKLINGYNIGAGGSINMEAVELSLDEMVLRGNYAGGDSGAIEADGGPLVISNSTISNNRSSTAGGAIYMDDANADPGGVGLTITDSDFSNNYATGNGGAIYQDNFGAGLVIEGSSFTDNYSAADGGAIYNYDLTDPLAGTEIRESLFSGNTALGEGGAIDYDGGNAGLTIENMTVTGNSAGSLGGGLNLGLATTAGTAITGSTFAGNRTAATGGGISSSSEAATLTDSIVADNAATSATDDLDTGGSGSFALDYSLFGSDVAATATTTQVTPGSNILDVDPKLGPLADNGGPTLTQAPLTGSKAIDAGISGGLTTDQRGLARPSDLPGVTNATGSDGSDIGAVELQAPVVPPDTAVAGATISAKGKQKQKGKKIVLKLKGGASEAVTGKASGKITSGKKKFKLKPLTKSSAANATPTYKLKPKKSKDSTAIAKLLKKGKKVKASLSLKLTDEASNSVTLKKNVKLK